MNRPAIAALVVGGVVAIDLVSKELVLDRVSDDDRIHVLGPLAIVHRRNSGGAFSVADGRAFFPWLVSGLIVALLVWFVQGLVSRDSRLTGAALIAVSAMVGGALGNQVDRWFRSPGWNRGSVVDFLDVGFWPVFNIADAALVCGAISVALLSLRRKSE